MSDIINNLELYKNSDEVKAILNAAELQVENLQSNMNDFKNLCFVGENYDVLKHWLKLYNPFPCPELSDKERIINALRFFAGATKERIVEIASQICKCDIDRVVYKEELNHVIIGLPLNGEITTTIINYFNAIKPAHVKLDIIKLRTHGEMQAMTHGELKRYTHFGAERG